MYDSTRPMAADRFRDDINVIGVPLSRIAASKFADPKERQLLKNIMYVGVLSQMLGVDPEVIATLLGDLGWALDALSDIHDDLAHGVFSLVWLELAEATGRDADWLIDPGGRSERALAALASSPVIDRILIRIHHQLAEIDRQSGGRAIAELCRYLVAAFLSAEPP
jgi:hypothetical protein